MDDMIKYQKKDSMVQIEQSMVWRLSRTCRLRKHQNMEKDSVNGRCISFFSFTSVLQRLCRQRRHNYYRILKSQDKRAVEDECAGHRPLFLFCNL